MMRFGTRFELIFDPKIDLKIDPKMRLAILGYILMSIWGSKMGSKSVPNRIFDVESVRKPLDRHLGGYQSALEGILAAPERILAAIYRPCGAARTFPDSAGPDQQDQNRGSAPSPKHLS